MLTTVPVPPTRLEDYAEAAGTEAVERLREAARPLRGATLLHVNSTAFGGGVSELLRTQVPLLNDLGIETTWAVIDGSEDFFAVTKRVHNALQGAKVPWTRESRATYWECLQENAAALTESFDFFFIHDPQPAGLLQILEGDQRRAGRWVWRCHIDASAPFAPVWGFFEPMVNRYDAAVFTLEDFARPGITGPKVAFIPPSIDPISQKNAPLPDASSDAVLRHFGVDPDRPFLLQVSRFDPWKDPLGVIDAFRLTREVVDGLQLVMVGSMADDDPEGKEFLERTDAHRNADADIRLLTNLDGVGDTEVNALQRSASVVLQKSLREGFGLTVSEGMWKERPVIGGNVGGIRLQIVDGVTGFLVDSVKACADRAVELLRDPELAEKMGRAGHDRVRERFLTLHELERCLGLLAGLG